MSNQKLDILKNRVECNKILLLKERHTEHITLKDVLKLLGQGIDIHYKNDLGRNYLHLLALVSRYDKSGKTLSSCIELLSKGMDINSKDGSGNTMLHLLSYETKNKSVLDLRDYILSVGANPNIQNSVGNTPIHISFAYSLYDLVDKYIEYNGDINIKNNFGIAPLHLLGISKGKGGHGKFLKRILPLLENINDIDNCDNTYAHVLATKGYLSELKFFIENGADVNLVNSSNKKPLECIYSIDITSKTFSFFLKNGFPVENLFNQKTQLVSFKLNDIWHRKYSDENKKVIFTLLNGVYADEELEAVSLHSEFLDYFVEHNFTNLLPSDVKEMFIF